MSGISRIDGRIKNGQYVFVFPEEVISQNYMMLQVLEKTRKNASSPPVENVGRTFIFPMPGNLAVASKMDYEQKGLGALGALAAGRAQGSGAMDDISGLIEQKFNSLPGMGNDTGSTGEAEAADLTSDQLLASAVTLGAGLVAKKYGGNLLGGIVAGAGGANVLAGLGLSERIAINPHLAVLFKQVGLRQFAFQYKFIARNAEESDMLRDIIRALQYHMHPEYFAGNFAFRYPDEFKLYFSSNRSEWLFNIKKCVLTDMTVNYNGENMPIFFEDVGGPVSIDINMSFQETEILTKKDYAEDYEVSKGKYPARDFTGKPSVSTDQPRETTTPTPVRPWNRG